MNRISGQFFNDEANEFSGPSNIINAFANLVSSMCAGGATLVLIKTYYLISFLWSQRVTYCVLRQPFLIHLQRVMNFI